MSPTTTSLLLTLSPLRQRRVALPVALAMAVLLAFALIQIFWTIGALSLYREHAFQVFVIALALSTAGSLVPFAIVCFLDRRERESRWLILVTLLWGALIATGVAIPFNDAIFLAIDAALQNEPAVTDFLGPDAAWLIGAPIAGPWVEEILKSAGIVLIFVFLRGEFDGIRDGFIYGALVGIGFNWLEAAVYVGQGFAEVGLAPFGLQLGARYALFGLSGHALYSGLFGAFLGWAIQTDRPWWRIAAPVIGLGLAIGAHTVNNSLGLIFTAIESANGQAVVEEVVAPFDLPFWQVWITDSLFDLFLYAPFLLILLALLLYSAGWERTLIRTELADEVPTTVTPEEYVQVLGDRLFRTRRIDDAHRRQSAELVNAQNELAFRKHRVKTKSQNPDADPLVLAWRGKVARLRQG